MGKIIRLESVRFVDSSSLKESAAKDDSAPLYVLEATLQAQFSDDVGGLAPRHFQIVPDGGSSVSALIDAVEPTGERGCYTIHVTNIKGKGEADLTLAASFIDTTGARIIDGIMPGERAYDSLSVQQSDFDSPVPLLPEGEQGGSHANAMLAGIGTVEPLANHQSPDSFLAFLDESGSDFDAGY